MPSQSVRDIVIIGGGASAALVAWNLGRNHGLVCTIVAPSDRPSFGLAYSTPSLKNLLNVAAGGMSADPDDPHHFLEWIRENVSPQTSADTFVPRAIFGLYLRNLYCMAAPEHVSDTAITCRREGSGYVIGLAGGGTLRARHVVLACGHFAPTRLRGIPKELDATGRYHHDAWSDSVFAGIGERDEVLLIGTGLTTVDVIMRLREVGHRGRITALSRRGLFPHRHALHPTLPAPLLIPGATTATARAYLQAFRAGLRRGIDWRAAVDSLRPVTNNLWLALPDVEKLRFRRHLQRRWEICRHRMAPQIADIIDRERQESSLRVLDGHVSNVETSGRGLRIKAQNTSEAFSLEADHVINCTGPSLNYRQAASPLFADMFETGQIVPGLGGAGLQCQTDGALIGRDGRAADGLFSIGPARLGTLFESIAIPEIRQQAHDLAALLARKLVTSETMA